MERDQESVVARGEPAWIFLFAGWLWATSQLAREPPHSVREHDRGQRGELVAPAAASASDTFTSSPSHRAGESRASGGSRASGERLTVSAPPSEANDGASDEANDERSREIADLAHMSLRELRRLPGVGQVRALAIARARWDATAARDLSVFPRVHGVGPATLARIHAWLAKSH